MKLIKQVCLALSLAILMAMPAYADTVVSISDAPVVESVSQTSTTAQQLSLSANETTEVLELNREQGLYTISKDGYVFDNQHIAEQWEVHDICEKYNLPERFVFGMIIMESEFKPTAKSSHGCKGLCQISSYWLRNNEIPRYEDNPRERDLYNAHDNLITMAEMMNWAAENYGLDPFDENDWYKLLYWWNTGRDPRKISKWKYSGKCISYAKEIKALQGDY